MPAATDPTTAAHYYGLCRKTASIYVNYVEEDYEDIVQILHMKCWRALQTYDSTKSAMTVQAYVFGCMKNQCKDLVKKKKRNQLYIEDLAPQAPDVFDLQYLSQNHDDVFGELDEGLPELPDTLTPTERAVVCLLYRNYLQREIALRLGIKRSEVDSALRGIRVKMAHWSPTFEAAAA